MSYPTKSKKTDSSAQKTINKKELYVVGVGASAGGLDAIEQLLGSSPEDTGLAFVIITHLERSHSSILPELIRKKTHMIVTPIKEGMKVESNSVYVIPPNKNVFIKNGILHLVAQENHPNLPINFFFESLAEDKKENSIVVILSGSGSDGTLGLKNVKSEGGMVIVQDPLTAKFDGMPRSAIETGLPDFILPPEKIIDQILKCLKNEKFKENKLQPELQQIFMLLRTHTGHDFTHYKLNTIYRRIERQMHAHHVTHIKDYLKFLRTHPNEINALFKDLLIGVTRFFRDEEAFEILKNSILPKLLKNKSNDNSIRVWIPGCSSGEETYSIAIIIREHLEKLKSPYKVQIFGTDIDLKALEVARSGFYPDSIVNEISQERLKRFFTKEKNGFKIKKEIREMVVFGIQNIIKDPPFTKLDLICCRNLLIYFNTQLQKQLFPILHYSLKPKGILFLGTSESIGGYNKLFRLIVKKWKIFERKDAASYPYAKFDFSLRSGIHMLAPSAENQVNKKPNIETTINHYLLDHFAPPCIIINKTGDILYQHKKMEKYLKSVSKEAPNFYDIFSEKFQKKIATAIRKANRLKKLVLFNQISIKKTHSEIKLVNLKIKPILDQESVQGLFCIIFEDVHAADSIQISKSQPQGSIQKRHYELQEELQYTKENLQSTIEELQSSNEELQSTNEELQSTNEEIETSKEELQSLNEELVSVNTELQNKIDELASVNDDMTNLFNSTEIAAIFLDNDLHIKRFTPRAQRLIPIIKSDAGRSLQDFATNIKYENLILDAKEVLKNLIPKIIETRSKNNKYYRIRILPYRTLSNLIDGVIIIFDDITQDKEVSKKLNKLNTALNNTLNFTKSIFDTISQPMLVLNSDLKIFSVNRSFCQYFKLNSENILNKYFYSIERNAWDIPKLRTKLEDVIKKDLILNKFEIDIVFPTIGRKTLNLYGLRIFQDEKGTNSLLLVIEEGDNHGQ
jgi:two-component system CheB/CheR fusion protein